MKLNPVAIAFLILSASACAGPEAVVTFNEIHYNPSATQTSGEWIELRNQHAVDVDLSGWRLDGGVDFVFPAGTKISGGGYLVIAANPGAFTAATGVTAVGPFSNVLANEGERVTLKNRNGRVMDEVDYNDRWPWPVAADGSGATLAKISELTASTEPRNWRACLANGGTPGDYNFTAPAGALIAGPSPTAVRRYFPFEGTAQDASGNALHGTLVNGATFSAQTPAALGAGQSLDCDGVNDHVVVLDPTQPTAYTISCWVKADVIRAQGIIVRTNAGGPGSAWSHQLRMTSTGRFEHYLYDGAVRIVTGTTAAVAGQWYHVAIVALNGGTARLYVNGVEQGAAAPVTALWAAGDRWIFGANSGGGFSYFDGRIDDLAMWHTPFDAAAVLALYNTTAKPTDMAPLNIALNKAVINGTGHYPNLAFSQPGGAGADFHPSKVTDGSTTDVFSSTYWLGREGVANESFIVDLGAPVDVRWLYLRNTHNTQYNDRATLSFRVFASSSVDGTNNLVSPVQILSNTLARVDNQSPIQAQAFSANNGLTPTTARYLKFESLTALNNNAGLNEFEVYSAFTGAPAPTGGGTTGTHPPDVPLAINEISAAGSASFFVELHNYGAALPVGGYVIAGSGGGQFVIPPQTLASGGFLSFTSAQLGFTPASGEILFLFTTARSAVLDGAIVKLNHQARRLPQQGVATPGEFLETTNPAEQTPGAINNVALPSAIVINEIMYHHRPQFRDGPTPFAVNNESWVELHNKSATPVDVSGWRLRDAVDFTFPAGSSIAAGGFAVIANDKAAFDASHPGVSAAGQFSGGLSNAGERLTLRDGLGNVVDDVNYRTRKPWPEFAGGGGSSLELRDPNADNSAPEVWAASDETSRSSWQNYTFTLTAATPTFTPNIFNFHELRLGLLDAGEVMIDDVSVIENPAGANRELMQNGTFSSGTTAWRLLGNHETSGVVSDAGNSVLKVVALGARNYHPNVIETSLKFAGGLVPVVNGSSYKISFRAKWLRGSPQLHAELYYNKVVKTVILAQPALSGTPGAPNSTLVANLGPTFADVRHTPVIPNGGEAIVVSARAGDPQGLNSMTLRWLLNGVGSPASVPMSLVNGRWTGTIPGQAAGSVVQFWLEGRDGSNVLANWPAAGQASRALVQVQDARAGAGRQNLRLTMIPGDSGALYLAHDMMSQRHRGCTIVHNESEVFYDSELRLHGSMFTRNNAGNGAFNLYFPSDHPFRGLVTKAGFRISGRAEIVIKHLINAAGGIPENYNDIAWMVGPTTSVGNTAARLEVTEFDANYFADDAADGTRGTSFKMEGIREYQTTVDGNPESRKSPWPTIGWVFAFDIANEGDGGTKPELYRHNLKFTANRAQDDNARIVAMCQAFSLPAGTALDSAVAAAIDADQWMRTLALESLCGIGDAYGFPSGNPHNINFYQPPGPGARVQLVPWDWNFMFHNATNSALLPNTHNIQKVCARPVFARLFYGHVRDLCNTAFNASAVQPWLNHYALHTGEGYGSYATYITNRRTFALSVLPANVPFNITTNGGGGITVAGATATIEGDGWINVREIRVNGSPATLPVTWLDGDSWRIPVPVAPGANSVTLTAYDHQGALVGTDTISVTGSGTVAPASAANLVVSELMYNPASGPEFIELMNIGASTIDLTNCAFTDGVEFAFSAGTTLAPGARVVINASQFLNGSGLSGSGERLILSGPGGVAIKDFTYDDNEPWPAAADGAGWSLTLVAPRTNPDPANPLNWRPSVNPGGSPGGSDASPAPVVPLGDDDGDGDVNLLEYAATLPGLSAGLDGSGRATITFARNLAADDAIYIPEVSTDLVNWVGGAAIERAIQALPVSGIVAETWRTVVPGAQPAQHLRLRVQLRP
jgi:Concanavalin A-like lectin/glucanases superfamily/Lamin Tail Domain/CotH kinase protein